MATLALRGCFELRRAGEDSGVPSHQSRSGRVELPGLSGQMYNGGQDNRGRWVNIFNSQASYPFYYINSF